MCMVLAYFVPQISYKDTGDSLDSSHLDYLHLRAPPFTPTLLRHATNILISSQHYDRL